MSSLRPWRLCGEISILDKNDLRPVHERGFWRDDQEPKCMYASLTPILLLTFAIWHFIMAIVNYPALTGGAFKKLPKNIWALLVTLNSFQGLIYFLDSEPSSE